MAKLLKRARTMKNFNCAVKGQFLSDIPSLGACDTNDHKRQQLLLTEGLPCIYYVLGAVHAFYEKT